MTDITHEQIIAGQAAYSPSLLKSYDLIVVHASCRWAWKCPSDLIVAHYDRYVSANHLDVGVGTGYFLDHCRFPTETPRIALMDLNEHALAFAAAKIARYKPETHRANVLEPASIPGAKFDSVGMNFLLHCVPGDFKTKGRAFDHLRLHMNDGATLFGSTILGAGIEPNWIAKRLLEAYNRKGIFSNSADTLAELEDALRTRFSDVKVKVVGCVAFFSGRK